MDRLVLSPVSEQSYCSRESSAVVNNSWCSKLNQAKPSQAKKADESSNLQFPLERAFVVRPRRPQNLLLWYHSEMFAFPAVCFKIAALINPQIAFDPSDFASLIQLASNSDPALFICAGLSRFCLQYIEHETCTFSTDK